MDRRAWSHRGCAGMLLLALAAGGVNGASLYASPLPRGPLYTFSRSVAVGRGDGLTPAPGEPELGRYRKWLGTNRVKKGGEHQLVSQMLGQ